MHKHLVFIFAARIQNFIIFLRAVNKFHIKVKRFTKLERYGFRRIKFFAHPFLPDKLA